jgi:hypothetical protein
MRIGRAYTECDEGPNAENQGQDQLHFEIPHGLGGRPDIILAVASVILIVPEHDASSPPAAIVQTSKLLQKGGQNGQRQKYWRTKTMARKVACLSLVT